MTQAEKRSCIGMADLRAPAGFGLRKVLLEGLGGEAALASKQIELIAGSRSGRDDAQARVQEFPCHRIPHWLDGVQ